MNLPGFAPAAGGHIAEFWPTFELDGFTLTAALEPLG